MQLTDTFNALNISFGNSKEIDAKLFKDIYGVHFKIGDTVIGDAPSVLKKDDYLYEITIDEYDEEYAYERVKKASANFGYCSAMRKDNYVGRNYDWNYDNKITYIVKVPAKGSRHASVGVAQCPITKSIVEKDMYDEAYKLLPFQTLDGINDCGVYANINVVPTGDKGKTTGTNPGKKDLYNAFIIRFILDNASSAKDAIRLLNTRNIKSAVWDGELLELHALICDIENSYIVEFVNNEIHVMSDTDEDFEVIPNNKAIITNFYHDGWTGEIKTAYSDTSATKEEIDATGLTPHAEGLERYQILSDAYDSVSDVDSMIEAMQEVYFTKGYDTSLNPYWYSEFVTTWPTISIYSSKEDFEPLIELVEELFENRSRDTAKTWQTVHTSAYDLVNKSFKIITQEQTDSSKIFEYTLNVNEGNNDT